MENIFALFVSGLVRIVYMIIQDKGISNNLLGLSVLWMESSYPVKYGLLVSIWGSGTVPGLMLDLGLF